MKACIALALVACASAGDANWWGSFDRKGWSYCDKTTNRHGTQLNYMSGLYRNHCHSLYCVEMARCDSTEHQKFSQTCYNANWWGSFDRKGWSTCKNGYFITGFYRNHCHQLYCLEEAHCCGAGPQHNAGWGKCYNHNWWGSFDRKGWSTCNKGYNMAGLYRNHCHHLYCLEEAKCCQPSAKVPMGWNTLKTNTQGSKTSVTDVFPPFTTNAIRIAKSGAIKYGWFRVAEIDAFDFNGKQIKPMGARTDNYYGGWRKSSWAAELFDDSTNWGKGTAVHFQNHATVWFASAVTIKTLKFTQIPHGNERYNQVNWKWQWHHGTYTGQMPAGWNVLKTNTQGSKTIVTDMFSPFKTNAIRVIKSGAIKHGWFRVAEIDAFDVNHKQITAMGARTDNYYGGWRKSTWAAELFDDNTNWGKGKAVHFKNHATVWFKTQVTIKYLRFTQIPHGNERYNQVNWQWQFYNGKYTGGVMPTAYPTAKPTAYPTAKPTAYPTSYPTPAPTGILSHATCKATTCVYSNGQTEVFTKGGGEKFHCEKVGRGCKCVCHSSLKCALRHHHTSGYKKTFEHC